MTIQPGTPVSVCILGDSYAGEVVVTRGKTLVVQRGSARTEYSLRKDGKHWEKGNPVGRGTFLHIGQAIDRRGREI